MLTKLFNVDYAYHKSEVILSNKSSLLLIYQMFAYCLEMQVSDRHLAGKRHIFVNIKSNVKGVWVWHHYIFREHFSTIIIANVV